MITPLQIGEGLALKADFKYFPTGDSLLTFLAISKRISIERENIRFSDLEKKKITSVSLKSCFLLDINNIEKILSPYIESLYLEDCPKVDEQCLLKIVQSCPKLKTLHLANLPKIQFIKISGFFSDDPIFFPQLEDLVVSDCSTFFSFYVRAPALRSIKTFNNPLLKSGILISQAATQLDIENNCKISRLPLNDEDLKLTCLFQNT